VGLNQIQIFKLFFKHSLIIFFISQFVTYLPYLTFTLVYYLFFPFIYFYPLFLFFDFKDDSLEDCIVQAQEHIPAEQNVELQDEQANLENLPLDEEYVAG